MTEIKISHREDDDKDKYWLATIPGTCFAGRGDSPAEALGDLLLKEPESVRKVFGMNVKFGKE